MGTSRLSQAEQYREFKGIAAACGLSVLFWFIAVLIVLAVLFFSAPVKAEAFVELGVSHQEKQPCYLWNQRCVGFDNKEDLTDAFYRIGYVFDVGNKLGIGVSAFNLGKTHTDSIAASDENCVFQHPNNPQVCGATQRYVTDGSVRGVALTLQQKLGWFRYEVGPTLVRRTFVIQTDDGLGLGLHDRVDLLEVQTNKAYGMGYMLSIGVTIEKNVSLFASIYNDNVGGRWPCGFSKATAGGLRVSF